MYKKTVIDYFGTQRSVAKALGISDAAVSQWKDIIPEKDAYRLEIVTAGALKYDDAAYRKATRATTPFFNSPISTRGLTVGRLRLEKEIHSGVTKTELRPDIYPKS